MSEDTLVDKELEQKIETNTWEENFDEVTATIKELTSEDSKWTWIRNGNCKYIELRIDMRDGGFVILDRNHHRISLNQLKHQYGKRGT